MNTLQLIVVVISIVVPQVILHVLRRNDLSRITERLVMVLQDLIDAGTTLSTASDALSGKVDKLVTAAEAVVAALQNVTLPPAAEQAVAALKTSAAGAATAGDKVDAEVTKLDTLLPTPAPAGTP